MLLPSCYHAHHCLFCFFFCVQSFVLLYFVPFCRPRENGQLLFSFRFCFLLYSLFWIFCLFVFCFVVFISISTCVQVTVNSRFGVDASGGTAVVELALACGLAQLPETQRIAAKNSTAPLGELLRKVREICGPKLQKVVIGLGGSATNDGGAGALRALGANVSISGEKEEDKS